MSIDPQQAVNVDSVGQEYAIVAATPCACGGRLQVTRQTLLWHEGRYYDRLEVVCTRCGQRGEFLFDIHTFFGTDLSARGSRSLHFGEKSRGGATT